MRSLKAFAHGAENAITRTSRALNVVGIAAVGVLMLLITSDVLGRALFNSPIPGTTSISEYVLVIAVYCSVAYCAMSKSHVNIELFVMRFPEKVQAAIHSFTSILGLGVLSVLVWRAVLMVAYSWSRGENSGDQLDLPVWPFRIVVVIGITMFCLVLITEIAHLIGKAVKK